MDTARSSSEDKLRSVLEKAEIEALEALKLQYFQNATKFLARGEYDSALAEIKRVLVIDPNLAIAREYEQRVAQLQASRKSAPAAAPPPPPEPVVAHKPRRASSKVYLAVAVMLCILLGTAGILIFDRGESPAQAPPVAASTVQQPQAPVVPVQAEAPVQSAQVTAEEPAPAVTAPAEPLPKPSRTIEKAAREPEKAAHAAPVSTPPAAKVVEKNQEPAPAAAPLVAAVTSPAPEKKSPEAPPAKVETETSAPFVAVEKGPQILKLQKPDFPEILARNGFHGEVTVRVKIDTDGKPLEAQVLKSSNELFEKPVIEAVMKSSFSPGTMGSGPVVSWMVIPFRFK